jgi:predicted PurR-regulated permease PerM
MAGMIGIALIVGFFLLLEGDTLLNNILNITPRWTDKKNTVQLVYKLEDGVSKYLLTVSLINIALGVAVAIAMWLLGVPNAMLWGVLATLLNFIPFLGALLGVVIIFLVSVFSFDSLGYALVPPSVFLILTTIEGNFITPSLVGRSVSVNSVAVLLSLILWGWLWGIGGAFVGVPLLIIFKLICDQFERTAPIGALLSGR